MIEHAALAEGEDCRFCQAKPGRRVMVEGKYGFAAWDRHPASPGHFLVIPYRHIPDYFDISDEEREDLWRLVAYLTGACLTRGRREQIVGREHLQRTTDQKKPARIKILAGFRVTFPELT
jgi:hypothetical protein